MNKMILMHILIFITCQISSFRLLRLNIKLFWKTSKKNYDLSFNVHLPRGSGLIHQMISLVLREFWQDNSLHSRLHQFLFYIACEIEGTKNGSNKVRRQTYYCVRSWTYHLAWSRFQTPEYKLLFSLFTFFGTSPTWRHCVSAVNEEWTLVFYY